MSESTSFKKKVEELKTVLNKRKREEDEKELNTLEERQKHLTQSIIETMDPYEGLWGAELCDNVCEKLKMEKEVVKKAIEELQSRAEKLEKAIKEKDVAAVTENIDLARLWVDGYYFFEMAVEANSVEIVTLFEQHHKIDFGPVEFLNLAIEKRFTEIVEYFLKTYDYTVESDDEVYEYDNPLLKAVETKDEKMVSLLFKYGSIYVKDGVKGVWHQSFYSNDDDKLFLEAIGSGVTSIVKMLIDAKIDVPASKSHEKLLKVTRSHEVLNLIVPYISVAGKRNLIDREKVYEVAEAKRRYAFGDLPKVKKVKVEEIYERDPKVEVLEPKKEFDKYGPHCINEKYYAKAVDKVIKVIDVSDKDERLQTFSLAVDKGVITDVALSGTDLLVGISRGEDFKVTKDVKYYDLTRSSDPYIIWDSAQQHGWRTLYQRFGPILGFGFCQAEPYILGKKKLVFPRVSRSFDFGEVEVGPEVLIAPERLRVYNLKKGETYYTRSFDDSFDDITYPPECSDKKQVGAYACIDKSGRYAVLSRHPISSRYFIRDLQKEYNIGYIDFAPMFVAKYEDFFVVSEDGDCYEVIESMGYSYSTMVRVKCEKNMAVYDDGAKVTCMKMLEDGKLQTFSFP